jgi:hypothetical protein
MPMLTDTKGIQQAALRSKRQPNIDRALYNNVQA